MKMREESSKEVKQRSWRLEDFRAHISDIIIGAVHL